MNLPWKQKADEPAVTAKTPLGQIRQLYNHYQKQSNLWGYTLLSSMVLICIWVLFFFLDLVDWTYLSLPVAGILISAFQMRRIKQISRILRNAHEVQQQIEKAEAEKKEREAAEAIKRGEVPEEEDDDGEGQVTDDK